MQWVDASRGVEEDDDDFVKNGADSYNCTNEDNVLIVLCGVVAYALPQLTGLSSVKLCGCGAG